MSETQIQTVNFPDGPSDDEMHAALFSLIDSGVREVWRVSADDEMRLEKPSAETIQQVKKHSTETEVTLEIKNGVVDELRANERRKWIEIRNTEPSS